MSETLPAAENKKETRDTFMRTGKSMARRVFYCQRSDMADIAPPYAEAYPEAYALEDLLGETKLFRNNMSIETIDTGDQVRVTAEYETIDFGPSGPRIIGWSYWTTSWATKSFPIKNTDTTTLTWQSGAAWTEDDSVQKSVSLTIRTLHKFTAYDHSYGIEKFVDKVNAKAWAGYAKWHVLVEAPEVAPSWAGNGPRGYDTRLQFLIMPPEVTGGWMADWNEVTGEWDIPMDGSDPVKHKEANLTPLLHIK